MVDEIFLPTTGQLNCDSYATNDDVLWAVTPASPGYQLEKASVDVDLVGPTYVGGSVTAAGTFRDAKVAFTETVPGAKWSLDALDLPATSSFTVGNTIATVDVDHFRVQLAAPTGNQVGTETTFSVVAGEALFLVMGVGDGVPYNLASYNSTAIDFEYDRGVWSSSAFELTFEDPDSKIWTLEVGAVASWD